MLEISVYISLDVFVAFTKMLWIYNFLDFNTNFNSERNNSKIQNG